MLEALRKHALDPDSALASAAEMAETVLALPKPSLPELLSAQKMIAAAAAEEKLSGLSECDVQRDFLKLTAAYEAEFWDDMARLNVLAPDAITRVSDYVPEVIAYIETIMNNGFCYEAGGSVYFDTVSFSAAPSKR